MGKTKFIEQLCEGDRIDELFLVKSVKHGETRAGKPYLVVTVLDKTGELSGPVWENTEEAAKCMQPGAFVRIVAQVGSYRESLQLRIEKVYSVAASDVDRADFMVTSRHDLDEMAMTLCDLCRSISDPYIKKLLLRIFGEEGVGRRFVEAPAAKKIHHAYVGGLLEHSLSMARVADTLAAHYPGVDRSLLLAGALLHDVGKVEELCMVNGVIDYTDKGRLKGHLVLGSELVAAAASSIAGFPEELLLQLQHLILSHHGRLEFGSPAVPMTVEAFLLQYIDELDSRMNLLEQLRRKVSSDEMGWSEYQRTLERYLYLGPLEERDVVRVDALVSEEKPATVRKKKVDDLAARQQSLF